MLCMFRTHSRIISDALRLAIQPTFTRQLSYLPAPIVCVWRTSLPRCTVVDDCIHAESFARMDNLHTPMARVSVVIMARASFAPLLTSILATCCQSSHPPLAQIRPSFDVTPYPIALITMAV